MPRRGNTQENIKVMKSIVGGSLQKVKQLLAGAQKYIAVAKAVELALKSRVVVEEIKSSIPKAFYASP